MIIRGQFSDLFMETMLPAINTVAFDSFNQYAADYSRLLDVKTSDRSIEQFTSVTGVGNFLLIPEGGSVQFDQPIQGFDKTFKHTRYGLGIKVSQDLVEDDKFGLVTRRSRELSRSMKETIELQAATIFNEAFTTAGPDGQALCSASHPLIKGGGVQSNLGTAADLSHDSLESALIDFEMQRDSTGKLVHIPLRRLIVSAYDWFNANEILSSTMRSDTANNTTNALKYAEDGAPSIFKYRRLTDTDSWFLQGDPGEGGLVWFWRRKPYTRGWMDDDSETGKVAMRYRASWGFWAWQGIYGNAGV